MKLHWEDASPLRAWVWTLPCYEFASSDESGEACPGRSQVSWQASEVPGCEAAWEMEE